MGKMTQKDKITTFGYLPMILGIIFVILPQIGEEKPNEFEGYNWEYYRNSERVISDTGVPEEYTCEQINIMIKTGVYPEHKIMYECRENPEAEYEWCKTHTVAGSQTKQKFVEYYLTECLEQKQ